MVRAASLYSVPLAGRLVTRNEATVPSTSEPDSDKRMVVSWLPLVDTLLVSAASLTEATLIEADAGVASCAPLLSIAAYWNDVEPLKFSRSEERRVGEERRAGRVP